MEIRSYRAEDAARLSQIHNQFPGNNPLTATDFHADALGYEHACVGVVESRVVGYAAVSTVPGLPHLRLLQGFIAPAWQRQRVGSQLLHYLIRDLKLESRKGRVETTLQLSYCTNDTSSAVYHFLRFHHFFIEHEEEHLILPSPPYPLAPTLPYACRLQSLSRSQVVTQFIHLYDQCFGLHPWYQPYSAEEVAALLPQSQDLLFLYYEDKPIGFVWARMLEEGVAEIEPMGVLGPWQGRGFGRFLLQSAIHILASRGVSHIHIGTWAQNKAALHLYRSLGFQPDYTLTYLAYTIDSVQLPLNEGKQGV
jgi:ribosomal protein S18 acetylase RimI-like enzyme